MRLLPCIRSSMLDDASTSAERQLEKIETFARAGGHELVPIPRADYDINVSGSVSPFERPGLGSWLRDDRLEMWDAICAARLDRLTRSLFDFVKITSWAKANSKSIVCLDPMLDLSTPTGQALASTMATFAQFERESTAARVRDAWHKLNETGKYGGGQVPFGYRPTRLPKGWGYEPDPTYGPIVAIMCNRYIAGESIGSITRWLNAASIPTPWNATRTRNGKSARNTVWRTPSVRKILASPAMLGVTIRTDATPVTDNKGDVIYRASALVSGEVWESVQARLRANRVPEKINAWPLSAVAYCSACGAAMYGSTTAYRDKKYRYYGCRHSMQRDGTCTARRVNATELEAAVFDVILTACGEIEWFEKDNTARLHLSQQIDETVRSLTLLLGDIQLRALAGEDVRGIQESLREAQAELAALQVLHAAGRSEPLATGQTFRQKWESLDAASQNGLLRAGGVRVGVSRDATPPGLGPQLATPCVARQTTVICTPHLHAVICLGNLREILEQGTAA